MVWKHVVKLAIPFLQFAGCAAKKRASCNPVWKRLGKKNNGNLRYLFYYFLPHPYLSENVYFSKMFNERKPLCIHAGTFYITFLIFAFVWVCVGVGKWGGAGAGGRWSLFCFYSGQFSLFLLHSICTTDCLRHYIFCQPTKWTFRLSFSPVQNYIFNAQVNFFLILLLWCGFPVATCWTCSWWRQWLCTVAAMHHALRLSSFSPQMLAKLCASFVVSPPPSWYLYHCCLCFTVTLQQQASHNLKKKNVDSFIKGTFFHVLNLYLLCFCFVCVCVFFFHLVEPNCLFSVLCFESASRWQHVLFMMIIFVFINKSYLAFILFGLCWLFVK